MSVLQAVTAATATKSAAAADWRQPVLFFGHGSPINALAQNEFTVQWAQMTADLTGPRRPVAILMISAHWYGPGLKLTAQQTPETIHDFAGFPLALQQFSYPAAGAPALAQQIQQLLAPLEVQLDTDWGLDHGCWSVLCHAFPAADIPVLQLSLDSRQSPGWHLMLGQRLALLREQGVLIAASGNLVHNLRLLDPQAMAAPGWALQFADRVRQLLQQRNWAELCRYSEWGSIAQLAVPHPDHFLPLLYAAGASQAQDQLTFYNDSWSLGSLHMLSCRFGL
jgi:4,5-DOPA dioxygenase extradiol